MSNSVLEEGDAFLLLPAEEFGKINREANKLGLMACVTAVIACDDEKLVTFHLVRMHDA